MTQGNQSFPDSNAADTAELDPSAPVLTTADRAWLVALLNEVAVEALTVRNLLDASVNHEGGGLVECAAARMVAYMGSLADQGLGKLGARQVGGGMLDWLASDGLVAAMGPAAGSRA